MKIYPPGAVTKFGAQQLKDGNPLLIYTSPENEIRWYLDGGLAPFPGVQRGAFLSDGMAGLHPPFSFAEHKGARQHGVTTQRTVYDPTEMDLQIEFSEPANQSDPKAAGSAIRATIADWLASWDPAKPGTLTYVTPEAGQWWCTPRLFRAPPDRVLRAQNKRLRQKFTWTVRNDDAFWRGTDSISTFPPSPTDDQTVVVDPFTQDYPEDLGPQWTQRYTGPGVGFMSVEANKAVWTRSGTQSNEVVNTLAGVNAVQTVASAGGIPTGGDFDLHFRGDTASGIPYNASAATVQSALEGMPSIGAGNVRVTGNPGAYTVGFQNDLGLQPVETMTGTSRLTGSEPGLTVGDAQAGAAGDAAIGTTGLTVQTGDLYYTPNSGEMGAPVESTPAINLFGWTSSDQQNGVSASIGTGGSAILYAIVNGVTSIIATGLALVATIANVAITLAIEVVEIAIGVLATVATLIVAGVAILAGIIGAVIGSFFELIGFGAKVLGGAGGQKPPPPVTGVTGSGPPTVVGGQLNLTNTGTEEGWPRYLCYGPGTFRISNGPGNSEMIEFGPLTEGQIALLTTLPRLRGVVDLTPSQPSAAITPEFDDFISKLISLATNNNVPPLLEWFQSLFGITPPQGAMYPLLKGRFTKPIPAKPVGGAAVTSAVAVQILDGSPASKIVGALTPLRRWPE